MHEFDTHLEVIPWMRRGYPPRGNVTVWRRGETIQAGEIVSGKWLSGEDLTPSELRELNAWAALYWDHPEG